MDEKIKEAFKEIVESLIEMIKSEIEGISGPGCILFYPRSVFMDALGMFEKKISVKEAIDEGLGNIFIQALDNSTIKTRKKDRSFFLTKKKRNKKRANWITPKVMEEAFGHGKRQPKDAI